MAEWKRVSVTLSVLFALVPIALSEPQPGMAEDQSQSVETEWLRQCAADFWILEQCATPEFRQASSQMFLRFARRVAALERQPLPLTHDEAVYKLSDTLRVWLEMAGPGCERVVAEYDEKHLDFCISLLRGSSD